MDQNKVLHAKTSAQHTEIQPQSVFYEDNTAQQSSQSNVSFYVESPSHGALLDNEAIIEYTLVIRSDPAVVRQMRQAFESAAGPTANPEFNSRFGLRQGFAINRACESCTLNINGSVLSSRPADWMDQVMRMYAEPVEVDTVCSMSGGALDSGSFDFRTKDDCHSLAQFTVADATVARLESFDGYGAIGYAAANSNFGGIYPAAAAVAFGHNNIPKADKHYNQGFTDRFHKMAFEARKQGLNGAAASSVQIKYCPEAAGVASSITLTVFERVPIAPFLLWRLKDVKRSIPNVNRFTLTMQFASQYKQMILQGNAYTSPTGPNSINALTANTVVDYWSTAPTLHLKWIIPPRNLLPRQVVSIPAQKILEFSNSTSIANITLAAADYSGGAQQAIYNNIRLEQVPDMFLIYAKPARAGIAYTDPCDHNLEIESLDVTLDGDSGKMIGASSADLYTLWLRNAGNSHLNRSKYEDWRRYHCVVALRPGDLGMKYGPGVNHPVTVNIRANIRSWHTLPSYGSALAEGAPFIVDNNKSYDMFVICIYDKYSLELRLNGSSAYTLQNMDKSMLEQMQTEGGSFKRHEAPIPLESVL